MSSKLHNISKLKNTGFVFKLLGYLLNEAIIKEDDKLKKFVNNIIEEYFNKETELYKELIIFDKIKKTKGLNEEKFKSFFNNILYEVKSIDNDKLNKEKYNLVKEFLEFFGEKELKEILKYRINDYKLINSVNNIVNYILKTKKIDEENMIRSFKTIKEHLQTKNKEELTRNKILKELKELDDETRKIAVTLLIEKFNQQFKDFSKEQKMLLNKYIIFGFNKDLKEYLYHIDNQIKTRLNEMIEKYKDEKKIWIKLNEFKKQYNRIINLKNPNEKTLLNILRALEMIKYSD